MTARERAVDAKIALIVGGWYSLMIVGGIASGNTMTLGIVTLAAGAMAFPILFALLRRSGTKQ